MIPTTEDISRLKPTPDFYKRVTDPELKLLCALLCRRVATAQEAVRKGAIIQRIKDGMQSDIVHFVYDKNSGEERPAFGTRDPEIIHRYGGDPKGEGRDGPVKTFTYFDLRRRAWRSFRPENIVRINDAYTL